MHVFDVDLVSSNPANEVHQPQGCHHPIVLEFCSVWELPDVQQQFQEQVHGVKEVGNAGSELVIDRRSVKELAELADEESAGDVVALGFRHEELVELADQLRLDLVEVSGKVVLGDDHAVQDLDGIGSKLIVMAQAQVQNLFNQRDQCDLVTLVDSRYVNGAQVMQWI